MTMFDLLPIIKSEMSESCCIKRDDLIKNYPILKPITDTDLYELRIEKEENTIYFILYEKLDYCSENDWKGKIIFAGYGFSSQREMRHTYFAPHTHGYLFYCPRLVITEAFNLLNEYFDE